MVVGSRLQRALRYIPMYLVVFMIIVVFLMFPFVSSLLTSLKPTAEVRSIPVRFFPLEWHLQNYMQIWKVIPLARYLANSLIISSASTVLCMSCGILAGYGLARFDFPGRQIFLYSVLITQMFSPIIILISLFKLFAAYNLLDTYWSLIITNAAFTLALTIWLLTAYFKSIPMEIEEASRMDGCGKLRTLMLVSIPIARPGVITAIIFCYIEIWNEFIFALTFISRRDLRPLTVGLYGFLGRYHIEWNLLMASSLLATAPIVLLFILIQKNLIKGLTIGAIK